ncbi:cyclopropane fatty-acyl-phospholipid synthase-like methyltransferase [Acinetobacter calcoaceticus]|uniref:Cyclopropane fatty-acyl-phospholipid synthase-like methyltransferase n=1 Tax=Acinetobacter calcoaceticus TaxID=471 RepID=A0A4R1Y5K8_ACICA|nr:cyclopropane fatty-acyl-phospholipid synthase-like methyltransferase [Acinetobacter calcoaceticus]
MKKRRWPVPSQHKYAIDSGYLGDPAALAWSNLGDWEAAPHNYVQACQHLADRLARAVGLSAADELLDLGCGQGASLLHWREHYAVQHLSAVELQPACVANIRQHLTPCLNIYQHSFYDLSALNLGQRFDVVLCIDAAYHGSLSNFLRSVTTVLKPQARLGFHYLIWSDQYQKLNLLQQQRYKYLLKAADVDVKHLQDQAGMIEELKQQQFEEIEVLDLSTTVLEGFANYVQGLTPPAWQQQLNIDYLKIRMTAKLCQSLYQQGMLRYVQVTATKSDHSKA